MLDSVCVQPLVHALARVVHRLQDASQTLRVGPLGEVSHPRLRALDQRQHIGCACLRKELLARHLEIDRRGMRLNAQIPCRRGAKARRATRGNPAGRGEPCLSAGFDFRPVPVVERHGRADVAHEFALRKRAGFGKYGGLREQPRLDAVRRVKIRRVET